MFRTSLRNVTAHKGRLLMTMLAVLLGVAFLCATLVFTDTFAEAYRKSSEQSFEYVDVAIRPGRVPESAPPGTRPALTQDLLHAVAGLPETRTVIGSVTGFTAIAGKDGAPAGQGWSTRGANYYPGQNGADPRYALARGRAPENAGEIMIDARSAERTGYEVGDTVRVSVDGPVLKEKLVGVFTTDDGEVAAGGTLTLFDTATAQRLFGEPGEFSEITAKAASGASSPTPSRCSPRSEPGISRSCGPSARHAARSPAPYSSRRSSSESSPVAQAWWPGSASAPAYAA
jgi:putative ABC transport system permease protein